MRLSEMFGCKPISEPVKPCPFCGGEPMLEKSSRWPKNSRESVEGYTVVCVESKCVIFGANNQYYRTPERAIKRWNERAEA